MQSSITQGRRLALASRLPIRLFVSSALLVLLALGLLLAVRAGAVSLSAAAVWRALWREADPAANQIVWNLRLPRALLSALIGAALAVAGALLQGVMRNPLAGSDVIGVGAGGALGAVTILILFPAKIALLPPVSFLGALGATLVIYALAWRKGMGTTIIRLVLAGVAVSSLLGAVTTTLTVIWNDRVQSVTLWLAGGFMGRGWIHLRLALPYVLAGLILALLLAARINQLSLGDEMAISLGLKPERIRFGAAIAAALLAGASVSVAGMIGFVGLMVPHLLRGLGGADNRWLFPTAALGGAALLVWADLAARLVLAPSELPVGILTALLGAPFFFYLLWKGGLAT
jgi:iron complex transport system permease protein